MPKRPLPLDTFGNPKLTKPVRHASSHEPGGTDPISGVPPGTHTHPFTDITGVATKAQLPPAIAYEDEANTFTQPVTITAAPAGNNQLILSRDGTTANTWSFAAFSDGALYLGGSGDSNIFKFSTTGLTIETGKVIIVGTDPGGSGVVRVTGAIRLTDQIISTLATGTAPFSIVSTTLVANLNADLLDGLDASAFASAIHGHSAGDITSGNLAYARLPTGGGTWANGGTLSITGGVTTVAGLTSTAVVLGPDGVVTAPTYAFANDPNTGLFSAGADALGLVTGGVERVRVTSTGSVLLAGHQTTDAPYLKVGGLLDMWVGSAGTGAVTTLVVLHATPTLQGGTGGPTGFMRVQAWGNVTGIAAGKTITVRTGAGVTLLSFGWDGADTGEFFLVGIIGGLSDASQRTGGYITVNAPGATVGAAFSALDANAVNMGTNTDLTIEITGQTVNSGDEVTLSGMIVEIFPNS